ncbi:unnamed protein product [Protopolystoma xenopodis]|uniref:Uncharacterized protein n=1 Tax=Protopolystoma xenopodis TaxID=117903 RepID=A0A3S5A455_9PLAT|nr:unnamed protein product [Protopolystoma xenopodis]
MDDARGWTYCWKSEPYGRRRRRERSGQNWPIRRPLEPDELFTCDAPYPVGVATHSLSPRDYWADMSTTCE